LASLQTISAAEPITLGSPIDRLGVAFADGMRHQPDRVVEEGHSSFCLAAGDKKSQRKDIALAKRMAKDA
jgi:hypothetical protein